MDYCDICFDPPRPLECQVSGSLRLDAREEGRRLLAELPLSESICFHVVEVAARQHTMETAGRTIRIVTVYNHSSLPLTKVTVEGGGAVADSVRINGLPQPGANPAEGLRLPGLGAGCAAVLTWEAEDESQAASTRVTYEYDFAGDALTGEVTAEDR